MNYRFRAVPAALLAAFLLRAPLAGAQRGPISTGVERIVAVGDLHGAYDGFTAILQGIGLVDADLHWAGGRSHLVQIGDVLDRGPGARKIFDLIRRLEGEAAAAGGRVHMLIGNHEAIAALGLTFDYDGFVPPEQFRSFLPDRYRQAKELEFRTQAGPGADLDPLWDKLARTDLAAQSAYFQFFRDHYGRWLAGHDTIVQIDGVVFVHGGLSEEYSRWPLERINRAVSTELLGAMMNRTEPAKILFDPRGPLWYRDTATGDESVLAREIDQVLANLKATAIVVGHTATPGSRTLSGLSRFNGRVWTIDTGMWEPFTGRIGALIITAGKFSVWGKDNEQNQNARRGSFGRGLAGGLVPAVR
jgi:hypothetical protein